MLTEEVMARVHCLDLIVFILQYIEMSLGTTYMFLKYFNLHSKQDLKHTRIVLMSQARKMKRSDIL